MIRDYVCLDIETTGCQSKWSKIIEIGAVKVKNGEIVDTFSELINPGVVVSEFITELTGISNDMVSDKPGIDQVMPRFIEFVGDNIIMGHNLMFDFSFLKQNAENLGMSFEKEGIDTLKISRAVLKELHSRKLDYLCEYFEIKDENHHRAYNDAMVTSQLYEILLEKYYETNSEVFSPQRLEMKVKKLQPITERQKKYLLNLCEYHRINMDYDVEKLTKNEASQKINTILIEKGRILY